MLLVLSMLCFGFVFVAVIIFLIYQDSTAKKSPAKTPATPPGPPTGSGTPPGDTPPDTGGDPVQPMQTGTFGKMPAWAQKGGSSAAAEESYAENRNTVAALNKSGKQIDLLLYGDSITRYLARDKAVWKRHFGGWVSAPLGVGGNIIEQLAWRIMSGNERPDKPPKCIALLIGVNNAPLTFQQSAGRLEELLRWLKKAYPSTKLVLMALLPATRGHNNPNTANPILRQLAQRLGITFAECGQSMNTRDARLYSDELHPTAAGYDIVLPCLKKIVESLIR